MTGLSPQQRAAAIGEVYSADIVFYEDDGTVIGAAALDERVQHLLVDEFQDTSRPHFALLRAMLADWQPGDGRTCFFVGDPSAAMIQ